ncbi:MAG: energy transducer TonB [bacterium]|nr:energy transducer TonB [bacterium]
MNLFNDASNNLDEVVFAQRNKAYGAYAIRKAYPENLNRSTLYTLSPFILFLVGMLLWNALNPKSEIKFNGNSLPGTKAAQKKVKEIVELASGFTFILDNPFPAFDIVADKKVKPIARKPEVVKPIEKPAFTLQTGLPNLPQMGGLGLPGGGGSVGEGRENGGGETGGTEVATLIEFTAEVMPAFPGGVEAMYDYISKHLHYPRLALENGVSGKVIVSFVIMPNGKVEMTQLERGIGFGCDEEALKVINEMPTWEPARQNGHKVPVRLILPMVFQTN